MPSRIRRYDTCAAFAAGERPRVQATNIPEGMGARLALPLPHVSCKRAASLVLATLGAATAGMAQSWLTPPVNAPVTLTDLTLVDSVSGTATITTAGYGLRFLNNNGATAFSGNIVDNSGGRTTELYKIGADALTLSGTIDVATFVVDSGDATLIGANRLAGADMLLVVNGKLNLGGNEAVDRFNGSGVVAGAAGSALSVNRGYSYCSLSGGDTFGLTKLTADSLRLYAASTYTGLTDIQAGELDLASGASLLSKTISIGTNAKLVLDDATNEQLNDRAAVAMAAGATFSLAGSERIQSLAGVAGSTVQVASGKALYLSGTAGGTDFAGTIAGEGGLTFDGVAGRMTLSGANTFAGPLNVYGGVVTLSGSVATETIAIGELDNPVNPSGILNLVGGGNHLADAAVVTITGKPSVSDAILRLDSDETVGQVSVLGGAIEGAGKLTATAGYFLRDGANITAKLGTGDIFVTGESVLNGTADAGSVAIGNTMGAASRLTVNGANLLTAAPMVRLYTNGQLDLRGDQTIGALGGIDGTVALWNHTLTIDQSQALSGTIFRGGIAGTGGLVKKGVGNMVVIGDLTYTGATDVQGGSLAVLGSLASTQVSVGDGAILGIGNTPNVGSGPGLGDATVLTINGGASGGVSFMNIDDTIAELHGASGTLGIAASASGMSASLTVTKGEFGGTVSSGGRLGTLIKAGAAGDVLTLTGTGSDVTFTRVDGGTLKLDGGSFTSFITVNANGVLQDTTAAGVFGAKTTLTNHGLVSLVNDTLFQLDGDGLLDVADTLTVSRGDFSGTSHIGTLDVVRKDAVDDILTLTGANTVASLTVIRNGGQLRLAGAGSLNCGNIEIHADSALEDLNGGLGSTAQLVSVGGDFLLGDDEMIASFYNNGGRLAGSGRVLTAGLIQSDGEAIFEADIDAGSFVVSSGNALLGGCSLGSVVSIGDGATLTTGSGNGHLAATTVLTLAGTGKLVLGGHELVATIADTAAGRIELGDHTLALSGNSTLLGTIAGTSASRLTVLGTLAADSSQLTYGVLDGSGTIAAASFVNKAGGTVKGTLQFTGAFVDNGILAPGNSPGTIVIAGNYTEAGTLQAELGGTTAGSYDQVRVGGTATIAPGATLAVQTYNGVQPARGDSYQVIADASGNALCSSGTFAHVTFDADGAAGSGAAVENAAVLFDVNTGRVIATGLNAAGSTYGQLASQIRQQSFVDALFANALIAPSQIDTATVPGTLVYTVVTSPAAAQSMADYYTPTVYSGMAGVAALGDDALARYALSGDRKAGQSTGKATFFAGSLLQKGDAADESDLRRNDYYVGGEYAFNAGTAAGLIVSKSDGKVRSDLGRDDADGSTGIAYASKRLGDFVVSGTVGYGVMDHELDRPTLLGTVSADADTKTLLGGLGVSYTGLRFGAVSVVPSAQLLYTRTKTEGFVETGASDALSNDGGVAKSFAGRLGAAVRWSTMLGGRAFGLEGTVAVDHAFSDELGGVDARFVGTPAFRYRIEYPENERTAAVVGAGIGYDITERSTLSIGGEVRLGDQSSRQLNCTYRFAF